MIKKENEKPKPHAISNIFKKDPDYYKTTFCALRIFRPED